MKVNALVERVSLFTTKGDFLKKYEILYIGFTFLVVIVTTFQIMNLWIPTEIFSDYMFDFLQFKIKPFLNIILALLQLFFLIIIRYKIKKACRNGVRTVEALEIVEREHKRVNTYYTTYYGIMAEITSHKQNWKKYGRPKHRSHWGHWEFAWEEEEDEGYPTMLGITLPFYKIHKLPKLFAVKS